LYAELIVQFEDDIHCAFKQPREARLTVVNRGLCSKTVEFGGCPCREDAKYRLELGHQFKGFGIQGREVSKHRTVWPEQGDARVADGIESGQISVVGEQIDDAIAKVNQTTFLDHQPAGRPRDAVFILLDVGAVQPECHRSQDLAIGQIFGDPHARNVHRHRGGTHQSPEEFLPGCRAGAIEEIANQFLRPAP
jgi:hypothetical protein